jgi:hypothetical protein
MVAPFPSPRPALPLARATLYSQSLGSAEMPGFSSPGLLGIIASRDYHPLDDRVPYSPRCCRAGGFYWELKRLGRVNEGLPRDNPQTPSLQPGHTRRAFSLGTELALHSCRASRSRDIHPKWRRPGLRI